MDNILYNSPRLIHVVEKEKMRNWDGATILIFAIAAGFILVHSKWFEQELNLITDIISSGVKEIQRPQ